MLADEGKNTAADATIIARRNGAERTGVS